MVLGGESTVPAAEFGGGEGFGGGAFGADGGEEGGVGIVEGFKRVEVRLGRVAGQNEEVDAGFRVEVSEGDEVWGVRDDGGRRKGGRVRDVDT